jgi:hypothetical protein
MVQLKRKDLILTLVWYPAILVLLDDMLYKELDEATDQIYASSTRPTQTVFGMQVATMMITECSKILANILLCSNTKPLSHHATRFNIVKSDPACLFRDVSATFFI